MEYIKGKGAEKKCDNIKMFHTHHAPVGAWASLTFGSPQKGVSIDFQEPNVKDSGTLLFGMANEDEVYTIGFTERKDTTEEKRTGDREEIKTKGVYESWNLYPTEDIRRTLTPSMDRYEAGKLSLTVHTPYDALPDPEDGQIPAVCCLPGIIMDLMVDNIAGKKDTMAFFGFVFREPKKIYASREAGLCSLSYRDEWMFAAQDQEDVFLIKGGDALEKLKKCEEAVHQNGPAVIGMRVPAGEAKMLTVAWTVYTCNGSNGFMPMTYYYRNFYGDLRKAAIGVLDYAPLIREISKKTDKQIRSLHWDQNRFMLFCQAVRAYYASSQLLQDENGCIHWNTCEGAYLWRNTLDLCADHLIWELKRNPWVVRSMMEDFIRHYSYRDKVVFPGKKEEFEGGLSFTHDMGCYFSYSEYGYSAYERENDSRSGFYFYMTTEQLLNGIYCIISYCLYTGDIIWLDKFPGLLSELMSSLENRDAPTAEERNGILKAVSVRSGKCRMESTTYDSLDYALREASGSLYLFIKSWCSLVLLKHCAQQMGDMDVAARAETMLSKCRESEKMFESGENTWMRANLYTDVQSAVSAVTEPLALPYMLGILTKQEEPVLFEILYSHSIACLQDGICIDHETGGLRLSSSSNITWTSKTVLTLYAMETVLGLSLPESLSEELIKWAQVSARDTTISDQILSDTRAVIGGMYYPRIVASSIWVEVQPKAERKD